MGSEICTLNRTFIGYTKTKSHMDDYERQLIEKFRAAYLRQYWKETLAQEEQDKLTRYADILSRKMADLIVRGKKRAEKEERFRQAMGMRLKTPKKK